MPISVVFDPPLPSDSPSTFNTKAFTLLGDLNDWSTQANALPGEVATNLTTLLAAPPAIGSTTPAAGNFTALSASGITKVNGATNSSSTMLGVKVATDAQLWVRPGTELGGSAGVGIQSSNDAGSGSTALTLYGSSIKLDGGAVTIPGSVVVSGSSFSYTRASGSMFIDVTSGTDKSYFGWDTSISGGPATAIESDGAFAISTGGAYTTSRFRIETTGAVTIPSGITQESVIAPTLLNSWVNYGGSATNAGYWKDTLGMVHLRGSVKSGTTQAVMFNLPAGYRPLAQSEFSCVSNDVFGSVIINANGDAYMWTGTNTRHILDGISFRAEA